MVKVIIERRVKPGCEGKFEELLMEMRSQAMYHSRSFLSGEVLTAANDPSVKVIIGTFLTLDSWKEWKSAPERKEIMRRMKPLLASRPRMAVYIARP